MSRLWDKGVDLDQRVLAYTAGDDYALDERLVKYDVRASIAHAEMLNAAKLLDAADLDADPRRARRASAPSMRAGKWKIELADEDGQTALEKRLTARIGAAGGRVHLGRSRNDQVLTALRLYLLDAARELARGRRRRARPRSTRSRRATARSPLPGYTHMQQAMPSTRGAVGGRLRRRAARRRAGRSPPARAAPRAARSVRPRATARRACRSIAS